VKGTAAPDLMVNVKV